MVRIRVVRYWKRYMRKNRYLCKRYLLYLPNVLGEDTSLDYDAGLPLPQLAFSSFFLWAAGLFIICETALEGQGLFTSTAPSAVPKNEPSVVPSDLLSRKDREIPRNAKNTIQFRELAERRIITKGLNGAAAWLRAKVGLFPIDIQIEQRGDVYEMVVRVTYRPLPPLPEVVYERQEP